MRIKAQLSAGRLPPHLSPPVANRAMYIPGDQVTLPKVPALEEAMGRVSDTHSELIERVRRIVGNPSYPPEETMQQIAILLATWLPRGIERPWRGDARERSHSE